MTKSSRELTKDELKQKIEKLEARLKTLDSMAPSDLAGTDQQIIFDSIPGMFWCKDDKNTILRCNQAAAATCGVTVKEMQGQPTEKFYPDEAAKYLEDDLAVIKTGASKYGIVERYQTKTGEKIWVRSDKIPYRNRDGKIIGVLVFTRDISVEMEKEMRLTESRNFMREQILDKTLEIAEANTSLRLEIDGRRRVEEKLRRSNAFLDAIIENIPMMIFLKEAKELRFIRLNKAGEEILGFRREELLGKNDYDFFTKEEADAFTHKDREVLLKGGVFNIPEEPIHTSKKEMRYLHTKKIPLIYENGTPQYLLGISEDITELKKISETESKLQEQLTQTDKLASLGRLSAGIAHELNSPLAGVLGLLRSFRKKTEKGSEDHEDLIDMIEACEYMAKIIKDLNAFSKKAREGYESLDLNEVINSTLSFSVGKLKTHRVTLEKEFASTLPRVRGYKSQIQQVLLNLISNACEAMSSGGKLVVRTQSSEDGEGVVVEVIDEGEGIDEQVLKRIFDPFFSTKQNQGGVGLGLWLTYGIVRNHKGKLMVESECGKGSKFSVMIPTTANSETHE